MPKNSLGIRHFYLLAVTLLGGATLLYAVTPAAKSTTQPGLQAATNAAPAFLIRASSVSALLAPAAAAPLIGTLPQSTFPDNQPRCSVQTPTPPSTCSVSPGVDGPCSVGCDQWGTCSAFQFNPEDIFCSVRGRDNARCSVLPTGNAPAGFAVCSTSNDFPGSLAGCSVIGPGSRQSCTALNAPHQFPNQCSINGATPNAGFCSVLAGGATAQNFCSVGRAMGSKTCSAYGDDGKCSILPSQGGACTAFKGAAPVGSCSVANSTGTCSVINGAGPNPSGICRP